MREMEAGQSPEWRDFDDRYPIYKSNYDQRKSLGVRSGVFERHWKSDDGIARSKVKEIRADMHGRKTGGHLGVNKTIDKVRQRCWLYLRDDVEGCQQCDTCPASRGLKSRSRGLMHHYIVGAPFERIAGETDIY